jgi:uncharacterized protein Yka (UPF0111/DUF47 family)
LLISFNRGIGQETREGKMESETLSDQDILRRLKESRQTTRRFCREIRRLRAEYRLNLDIAARIVVDRVERTEVIELLNKAAEAAEESSWGV